MHKMQYHTAQTIDKYIEGNQYLSMVTIHQSVRAKTQNK